jgi:hypothetical protein
MIDNLKVIGETKMAYGDLGHAIANLTFNQRVGGLMNNLLGEGDNGERFNSIVRALEIRGAALNPGRYQHETDMLYQAMIATYGKVNPDEFLTFSQRANPYTKGMTDRYLYRIAPSLIQESGGNQAGTMQNTWTGTILGKAKNKISTEAWMKLGLLDPKQVVYNKVGPVGWRPGAIKGTNLAMQDPLAWSEQVLIPAMKAHGVNTADQLSLQKMLMPLFRDRNANRLANALTYDQDRMRLHKDEVQINKVPGSNAAYMQALRNDPKMAWAATAASLKNLETVLGRVASPQVATALMHVANGINMLAGVFDRHPNFGKAVVALMGFGAVAATLTLFGIGLRFVMAPLGLFIRMLGPLVSLGPLILNALASLAPIVIEGLVTAFALLSNPIGWGIILAGVGLALAYYFRADLARAWPKVVAWFKGAWQAVKNYALSINWAGIGMKIADALTFGLASKFAAGLAKLRPSIAALGGSVGMNSTRGGLAGARASGGPVRRGGLYMVGERGPELWRAPGNGHIIAARRTAALLGAAGAAMTPMAAAAQAPDRPHINVGGIHIHGVRDPAEAAREVERVLQRLAERGGAFLSD